MGMNRIAWSRKELKEKSKKILKLHYWRMVLIALLLSCFFGDGRLVSSLAEPLSEEVMQLSARPSGNITVIHNSEKQKKLLNMDKLHIKSYHIEKAAFLLTKVIVIVAIGILLLFLLSLVRILVLNPLSVGVTRLFTQSFEMRPKLKELFYAFEHNYKNVVCVMLLRDIYTILWSLLLVVPGIVKMYEYHMIPYLLAEDTDMDAKEAFARSKAIVQENKWKMFVLDLSFVGWEILNGLTLGMLGIFFVIPYRYLVQAALYRRLSGKDSVQNNIYYEGMTMI